jgi:hypothetical protein
MEFGIERSFNVGARKFCFHGFCYWKRVFTTPKLPRAIELLKLQASISDKVLG